MSHLPHLHHLRHLQRPTSVSYRLSRMSIYQTQAKITLQIEAAAITALIERIDDNFDAACELLLGVSSRVVVIGMGKSGHIGSKIAATLASTGTPAFFVHPAEASHGDLGMITPQDAVLALSYSGETDEVLAILPIIKRQSVPLVAMTGNPQSTLAKQADVHLDISVAKEACPLNLAPTASSTATLALGDALAVAMLQAKGFNAEDFARSHPGGKLGKKLLTFTRDIMRTNDEIPMASPETTLLDTVMVMSQGGMGFVIIVDLAHQVMGVFTDGDLRRVLNKQRGGAIDLSAMCLADYMQNAATVIEETTLAAEALQLMEVRRISALPVVDANQRLVGAMNMHDLLRAGIA